MIEGKLIEGLVLSAITGIYTVDCGGHLRRCSLRGNLKKRFQYSTSQSFGKRVTRAKVPHGGDSLVVGDRVLLVADGSDAGVIEEVLPRKTRFARRGFRGVEQTVVCNIDQVLIVFACLEPRPDPWKIDRFLVTAELEGLDPLIIGNKCELVSEEDARASFAEWTKIGYRLLLTSAKDGIGIDDLRAELRDRISAVVGPSGVGKSSLLNAIQPELKLRTAEIGYVTFKGRHTTTASRLIPLLSGGWVADTPGLRNLGITKTDRETLLTGFPEINALLGQCRFDDCQHVAEPNCAIKTAVEEGTVSTRRYESFLALAAEMTVTKR